MTYLCLNLKKAFWRIRIRLFPCHFRASGDNEVAERLFALSSSSSSLLLTIIVTKSALYSSWWASTQTRSERTKKGWIFPIKYVKPQCSKHRNDSRRWIYILYNKRNQSPSCTSIDAVTLKGYISICTAAKGGGSTSSIQHRIREKIYIFINIFYRRPNELKCRQTQTNFDAASQPPTPKLFLPCPLSVYLSCVCVCIAFISTQTNANTAAAARITHSSREREDDMERKCKRGTRHGTAQH